MVDARCHAVLLPRSESSSSSSSSTTGWKRSRRWRRGSSHNHSTDTLHGTDSTGKRNYTIDKVVGNVALSTHNNWNLQRQFCLDPTRVISVTVVTGKKSRRRSQGRWPVNVTGAAEREYVCCFVYSKTSREQRQTVPAPFPPSLPHCVLSVVSVCMRRYVTLPWRYVASVMWVTSGVGCHRCCVCAVVVVWSYSQHRHHRRDWN